MAANCNTVVLSFIAGVSNGYAQAQTPGGAGNLTLNGSLVSGGVGTADAARRVVAVSSNVGDTTQTLTITGTDRYGNTISNTVTLNGTTNVYSALDFLTVTRIAISAATVGTVTAGTSSGGGAGIPIGSSQWIIDNFLAEFWALGGGITGPAGTTYTLELTYDDPNKVGSSLIASPQQFSLQPQSFIPPHVYVFQTLSAVSGDNQFAFANQPIFAHRLTINSGTGQVVMQSIQAGQRG